MMSGSISLLYRLVGYAVLATDDEHAAALLELCRRRSLVYSGFENRADGGIALCFSLQTARLVQALCASRAIPLETVRTGGAPFLLRRLSRRMGLVVGLFLGILLFWSASRVVWDIRISGNETVSDRAIEEALAACGFSVGSSLHDFRADVTANQVLLYDERLAWMSINRRGTVAYVEVRESATPPAPDESDTPADIVAAVGGIIERVELEEGNIRVMAGQAVGKGDVLVSGLWDSDRYGIRYTRAKARVYARTVHELTVTIPLSYEQKTYSGGEGDPLDGVCQEKSLNFFGKSIKFSKKTGNPGGICDTIESEESLGLFADVGFPISVRTVWYLPYTVTTATRTYAEAEELAYFELARQLNALPGGAELISKTITTQRGEEAFILTCTVTCIEDIGTVREIQVGS